MHITSGSGSDPEQRSTPHVELHALFCTCTCSYTVLYCSHAHRPRLEKFLLLLEVPTGANRFWIQVAVSLLILKPPHGGFRSEAAVAVAQPPYSFRRS
jgi:hypothetical protein